MSDWLPAWLTIDRAIAIAAVAAAVMAASLSLWSVLLTRRGQKSKKETKPPVLVFWVSADENANGWHHASLQRSRREPMKFYILDISVGRGFSIIGSIDNPDRSVVVGQSRALLIPSSGEPSRILAEWRFRNFNDLEPLEAIIFFLRPSGTSWRRRSSRVSLRLTLEEMSPDRRRTTMTIKSNIIDWKASAARSKD
jgi:hypothetical protein